MARMKKFMVIHRDPNISWKKVEGNWAKAANVESATWIRTFFNKKDGVRYCVWFSPRAEKLASVFKDLGVNYESILEVEETIPDLWGEKWRKHLDEDAKSDTLAF